MKTKEVHIRISEKRFSKLKNYATLKEKTVTQIIEDYIDRLPNKGKDGSSDTPSQVDRRST
ncbi:CopG domain protein DNA-binding domain protein [Kalymmatonema gypsitolerans NIES-4073]|nr:CopG domain protein DNA-binding domain protein [Scytonema sp. NIES-4073]